VAACSSGAVPGDRADAYLSVGQEGGAAYLAIGSVGAELSLPGGGQTIQSVSYLLTNGLKTYSGAHDVTSASTISLFIGSVAAGDGYTLTLSATSADGSVTCAGAANNISVAGRTSTLVALDLRCTVNLPDGSAMADAAVPSDASEAAVVSDAADAADGGPGDAAADAAAIDAQGTSDAASLDATIDAPGVGDDASDAISTDAPVTSDGSSEASDDAADAGVPPDAGEGGGGALGDAPDDGPGE
jgi:hypothetical protein